MEEAFSGEEGRRTLIEASANWPNPNIFDKQMLYSDAIKVANVNSACEEASNKNKTENKKSDAVENNVQNESHNVQPNQLKPLTGNERDSETEKKDIFKNGWETVLRGPSPIMMMSKNDSIELKNDYTLLENEQDEQNKEEQDEQEGKNDQSKNDQNKNDKSKNEIKHTDEEKEQNDEDNNIEAVNCGTSYKNSNHIKIDKNDDLKQRNKLKIESEKLEKHGGEQVNSVEDEFAPFHDTESGVTASSDGIADSEDGKKLFIERRKKLKKKLKKSEKLCKKCNEFCKIPQYESDDLASCQPCNWDTLTSSEDEGKKGKMTRDRKFTKRKNGSNKVKEGTELGNDDLLPLITDEINLNKIGSVESLGNGHYHKKSEINWFGFTDVEATKNWIIDGDKRENSFIKTQPLLPTQESAFGPKYRMIMILSSGYSSLVCHSTFDTGAFTSTISKKYCKKLKAQTYLVEERRAKGAASTIVIKENVKLKINFGSVNCELTFSVIDDVNYKTSLILLGSNFIDQLGIIADFDARMLYIMKKYPIKLYTSDEEAINKIWEIRGNYITEKGVNIQFKDDITIEAQERLQLDVKLRDDQASCLMNLPAFGRAYRLPDGLRSGDILVDKDFDYHKNRITIGFYNSTDRNITLKRRVPLFRFKSIFRNTSPFTSEQDDTVSEDDDDSIFSLYSENEMGKVEPRERHLLENDILVLEEDYVTDINFLKEDDSSELELSIFDNHECNAPMDNVSQITKKRKRENEEIDEGERIKVMDEEFKESNSKFLPYMEEPIILKDVREEDMPKLTIKEIEEKLRCQTHSDTGEYTMKKLPEEWGRKMSLEVHRTKLSRDVTRIVHRNMTAEDEKVFNDNVDYRRKYHEDRGKDHFIKQIKFGNGVPDDWKIKFQDLLWLHKDKFGEDLLSIKAGLKVFQAHVAYNGGPCIPAKVRAGNKYSKEVFKRVSLEHINANIIQHAKSEAYGNAHIIDKKMPEAQKIKTIEEIWSASSSKIQKAYRLTIDLSDIGKSLVGYSSPLPNPRSLLEDMDSDSYYFLFDLLSFFYQVTVDEETKIYQTFLGPGGSEVLTMARLSMGIQNAMGIACAISTLLFGYIVHTVYVDNLIGKKRTIEELYENVEATLKRAGEVGAVLKLSEIFIGLTTKDSSFQILGYSICDNYIRIPLLKKEELLTAPKSKKFIVKLLHCVSFYNMFSSQFSEVLARMRKELERQKNSKKFCYTPRLEKLTFCLLNLIKTNMGLKVISPTMWKNMHLILMCDASSHSVGGVLLGLLNGWLFPISAFSRFLSKEMRGNFCVNIKELRAVELAFKSFSQILGNTSKYVTVMTDSQYVYRCFTTLDIEKVPTRFRSLILDCKCNYHFGICKISGEDNYYADLMSRFGINQMGDEIPSHEKCRSLFKNHMKEIRLNEEQIDCITNACNRAEENSKWHDKHEEVKYFRENFPTVYSLNIGKKVEKQVKPCGMMEQDWCADHGQNDKSEIRREGATKLAIKSQTTKHDENIKVENKRVKTVGERIIGREREKRRKTEEIQTNDSLLYIKNLFGDCNLSKAMSELSIEEKGKSNAPKVLKLDNAREAIPKTKKKVSFTGGHTEKGTSDDENWSTSLNLGEGGPGNHEMTILPLNNIGKTTMEALKIDEGDTLQTVHEINDETIKLAKKLYGNDTAKVLEGAKYVLIKTSKSNKSNKNEQMVKEHQTKDQQVIKEQQTEEQQEVKEQQDKDIQGHNKENMARKQNKQKRKEKESEDESENETKLNPEKKRLMGGRMKIDTKKLTQGIRQSEIGQKMTTRNDAKALKEREMTIGEETDVEMENMENESRLDEEINYVAIPKEDRDGAGLNEVTPCEGGFEISRSEMKPIDDLSLIANSISDFNEGDLPSDNTCDIMSQSDEEINEEINEELNEGMNNDDSERFIFNIEVETELNLAERVKNAQKTCKETMDVKYLLENELDCGNTEVKSQTEYIKTLVKERKHLIVDDGILYINYTKLNGLKQKLIVVPPSMKEEVIRKVHIELCHAEFWRLEPAILEKYYISDLKSLCRKLRCSNCILARAPRLTKSRKIPCRSSTPGELCFMDLLMLPDSKYNGANYKVALILVDSFTNYCFGKPLRGKTGKEVCSNLMEILWSNSYIPTTISSDLGGEFCNKEVQDVLDSHGIDFKTVRPEYKDSNLAENCNFRVTNLMRKFLNNGSEWAPNLQKIIFSLNNSLMDYGKKTFTPSYTFSLRNCYNAIPNDENEPCSISKTIQSINQSRFKDHYSLGKAVSTRTKYAENELVLVLREHVTALKTSIKSRKLKLKSFWQTAMVENEVEEDCYILKFKNGMKRKCAKRIMKKIKPEQYDLLYENYTKN